MKLDIILRTHDVINIHNQDEQRYCNANKTTVVLKCVKSLIDSVNLTDFEIQYFWFDDHSSEYCVKELHELFKSTKQKMHFFPISENGWNASAYHQFNQARLSSSDLVYLVEDDYLHFPSAIEEMVNSYSMFKNNLGKEVAIHPFDDPDNYLPNWIEPSRIVYGTKRHWRVNYYTTNTVMCNPNVIRDHWSKWYTLATEYGTTWSETEGHVHEGTTINKIWRNDVTLFTPIPSVALHLQYLAQKDPYLDWKKLWDSISIQNP